ncbi:MAG TPA: 30S ribosome-binding factor RbfA [Bdellovibrionota bacterium]|nr:30S ribosome-binding factor RbfA [Bdellovibrionota bacterium]
MKIVSNRQRKVAEGIKQLISNMLIHELTDPRIGFVTVTDVEISADLKISRVFVAIPEAGKKETVLNGLQSAIPAIRRQIANELNLRFTPSLEFFYDETFERGERIESLLAGLKKNK